MKMHCKSCGCHFDNDFEETLLPECTMWKAKGFADNTRVEHYRAIWDAFFSVPVDAIADETGVIVEMPVKAHATLSYSFNQFEAYIPGYGQMTDQEKRNFQKKLFKFQYNMHPQQTMLMWVNAMARADKGEFFTKKDLTTD